MAEAGPSKEELEYYYKNSRQYFDELARHYYATDRVYYDKNIAPFYSPFARITPQAGSSKVRPVIFSIAILIAVLTAGIAVFLINFEQDSGDKEIKSVEESKEPVKKEITGQKKSTDTLSSRKYQIEYEKGLMYFNEKDYVNAERCFRRIPKSDKNYDNAQKMLKAIKELKKEEADKKTGTRSPRPQPRERTR
jgi:tetratricopeptide (TPR) repeat protein